MSQNSNFAAYKLLNCLFIKISKKHLKTKIFFLPKPLTLSLFVRKRPYLTRNIFLSFFWIFRLILLTLLNLSYCLDTNQIWGKVFKNWPSKICGRQPLKIWSDMVCWGKPYLFKFFKCCLPQTLLGPFLNTLSHILLFWIVFSFPIAAVSKSDWCGNDSCFILSVCRKYFDQCFWFERTFMLDWHCLDYLLLVR